MFTGQDAVDLGLDGSRRYHLCFVVVGMGDLNAVDIGQAYHEDVLKSGGCMQDGEVLQYGKPLPRGGVYEGVYIDDHLVVGKWSRLCSTRLAAEMRIS